ncbi:GTPase, partial [Planctomycetota bacterium]
MYDSRTLGTRYDVTDTILAVSSPSSDHRVIVRITGSDAIEICRKIWTVPLKSLKVEQGPPYLLSGSIAVDAELNIDGKLYLFFAPHSYTGDNIAEIHLDTNPAVTEALIENLLEHGLRMAEPGEFTARAFLNGKIDLAQAEAVNEIIVSTNEFQLAAAEKLLSGRLGKTTTELCENLMDCLSLIEVGLDFSGEDIEFITRDEAVARLMGIQNRLGQLLSGSIQYETVIDLPAVGIAGAPNAGKSSLLNKLLGKERSIVSDQQKTTRDVLTGVCQLTHCQCVLFDCAGLVTDVDNILDELAQQAAIEALRNSDVVIFGVD